MVPTALDAMTKTLVLTGLAAGAPKEEQEGVMVAPDMGFLMASIGTVLGRVQVAEGTKQVIGALALVAGALASATMTASAIATASEMIVEGIAEVTALVVIVEAVTALAVAAVVMEVEVTEETALGETEGATASGIGEATVFLEGQAVQQACGSISPNAGRRPRQWLLLPSLQRLVLRGRLPNNRWTRSSGRRNLSKPKSILERRPASSLVARAPSD